MGGKGKKFEDEEEVPCPRSMKEDLHLEGSTDPIEINLAALADRVFLTDLGRDFLDEFDLYGEW